MAEILVLQGFAGILQSVGEESAIAKYFTQRVGRLVHTREINYFYAPSILYCC